MALYLSLSSMYCSLLHSLSLFATFLSLNSKCKNLLSLSGVLHSWKMKFWFCYYMVYECTVTTIWSVICGMSKYKEFWSIPILQVRFWDFDQTGPKPVKPCWSGLLTVEPTISCFTFFFSFFRFWKRTGPD